MPAVIYAAVFIEGPDSLKIFITGFEFSEHNVNAYFQVNFSSVEVIRVL